MNDDINLKQVRMIMEQIARQRGCPLQTIEIADVREILRKGNNGTLGAYIKQVKLEFIESQSFDRHELSMEYKAATIAEFNRLLDNATRRLKDQRDAIDHDHSELLTMIDKVEITNQLLRDEIKTVRQQAEDVATHEAEGLAEARKHLAASEQTKTAHAADIENARNELADLRNEAKELTVKLAKAEAAKDLSESCRHQAENDLHEAQNAREEAIRAKVLAEQAATHRQEMISLLEKQNKELTEDGVGLKARAAELQRQLDDSQKRLLQTANDRIVDLRQSTVASTEMKLHQAAATRMGTDAEGSIKKINAEAAGGSKSVKQKRRRETKPSSDTPQP